MRVPKIFIDKGGVARKTTTPKITSNFEYDRVFGNNDALIIWHDGKVMNLKYTESIETEYVTEITDKSIDRSRKDDVSYMDNELNKILLDLEIGDVWAKDSPDGTYKKQNRNSALRNLYEIYDKNIPINFRSDIKVIPTGIITELNVNQSSDSDNTYIVGCEITEVKFIKELPQVRIKRINGDRYEERPSDEPMKAQLGVEDEEEEIDDYSLWNDIWRRTYGWDWPL